MVGNPPYLSQLSASTATNRGLAALIKARTQGATSAYTDTAAAFWIDAFTMTAPGGRVAYLLPQSVLASRDAAEIRNRLARETSLEHLWVSTDNNFSDALVATCASVVRKGRDSNTPVTRAHSLEFLKLPEARQPADTCDSDNTWGALAADAFGIPTVAFSAGGEIGSIADATADFRDEYYGLAGFITEHTHGMTDQDFPPLITSGMIDPASNLWGRRSSRILKSSWTAPRIDRQAMAKAGTLTDWIEKRRIPKLLVATQSRVIELIADEPGTLLPCMPVLTVTPKNRPDMWRLASALGSPVACMVSLSKYSGTALTTDAIKLAAKQLVRLPIPKPSPDWDRAAELYREACYVDSVATRLGLLVESAHKMNAAFNIKQADRARLMEWWTPRLRRTLTGKSNQINPSD